MARTLSLSLEREEPEGVAETHDTGPQMEMEQGHIMPSGTPKETEHQERTESLLTC